MINKTHQSILGLDDKGFNDALQNTHPKLAEHIAAGVGLELQKLDSDIAEEVILRLTREGIHCLPVHDSLIVISPSRKVNWKSRCLLTKAIFF